MSFRDELDDVIEEELELLVELEDELELLIKLEEELRDVVEFSLPTKYSSLTDIRLDSSPCRAPESPVNIPIILAKIVSITKIKTTNFHQLI
jgi:hypothetical protein